MSELFLAMALPFDLINNLRVAQRQFLSLFLNNSGYYLSIFNYQETNYVGKKLLLFYTSGFRLTDNICHFESLLKKVFPMLPVSVKNIVLIGVGLHEYVPLSLSDFGEK
ncbi:hypothetical protein [Candidatus Clavichlamydia salmonicola]|uniref:hypothetical protein n=1 Tax=Candidatus Clavichlamydia salmonicola TaxID=469812 RepID=UPI0018916B93|nr:hypothetical protein [Candidatus Clavichlamydia salmonicola]